MKTKSYQFMLALMVYFIFIGLVRAQQSAVLMSLPQGKQYEINRFGKCNLIIKNTMKGKIQKGLGEGGVWIRLLPQRMDLNIPLYCHSRNDQERLEIILGAKQVDGKWQPAGGYEKGCKPQKNTSSDICEFVDDLPFMPQQNMRAIPLKGSNWQGVGILIDDTTGRERTRQRKFRYCLYHAEVALCGDVYVRNLIKPHEDVLSMVLSVLKSIEFVDDVQLSPVEIPSR